MVGTRDPIDGPMVHIHAEYTYRKLGASVIRSLPYNNFRLYLPTASLNWAALFILMLASGSMHKLAKLRPIV